MNKFRQLVLIGALLTTGSLIAGLLVFAPNLSVKAADTQIEAQISQPIDQCPNIPGFQDAVPNGMSKDSNGSCYTPPPPPTDVCANLTGVQTVIPTGYYRDNNGDCYVQPIIPQDVCTNFAGIQTVVPTGLINDQDGNCIEPPKDACSNIPGIQTAIPDGMEKNDHGECATPPPPAASTSTPNPPASRAPLKNIPTFLAPAVQPLVDIIPASIKQVVRSISPEVARTFPYYIFTILGIAAVVMLWQAAREALAAKRATTILKREQLIAEEKDNFIALSSHYLHTPLTVMRNGVDTIAALKEIPPVQLQPLSATIASLKDRIDDILNNIEKNTALGSIKAPEITKAQARMLRSPFFWLPVAASAGLTLLSNFLLGVVGEVDLGIGNLTGQLIIFGAATVLLYNTLRTHHLRSVEHDNMQRLLRHEHTIDNARNKFIELSTLALREGLQEVENTRAVITGAPSARFFNDGYQRFAAILAKFTLLSQIETGASGSVMTFNMRDAINGSLLQHQESIAQKKISINNSVGDLEVLQNRILFGFVLSSIIDNAIKFSREGGVIDITAEPDLHTMRIAVSDNGIGVPADKLPHLFKPFSRAGSALQFDYEGLGFSLFLDKIIMDYLGGNITADSAVDKGTVVTITA